MLPSATDTVSVRDRIEGDLGPMSVDDAVAKLKEEIANRVVRATFSGNAGLGGKGADNEY